MKIANFICNLVFSFISLLSLYILYIDSFGISFFSRFLSSFMGTMANKIFSEYNILGLMSIYAICIIFIILTVILFIRNLIKKQNVLSCVLSIISFISMIVFSVLPFHFEHSVLSNSALYKFFCIFNAIFVLGQLIVSLIDTVKSYSIEYSE